MAMKKFVSIPEWAPVYTDLPHHFNGCTGLNVLCRAPERVIQRLTPEPLKAVGDRFILRWQHIGDCEGYKDVHFNEILFPIKWKDKTGVHCALEYIDNEMGLVIGREVWGFPKKWGDFIWEETHDGLHLECHREGELLMRTEFTRTESPAIQWPFASSYYLVKHIPPASRTGSPLIQVVRIDLDKKTLYSSTTGTATVELFDGQHDPLRQLGPVEILGARLDTMDSIVDYGEVVETISNGR
ncbi:acetoacetate decarboxylase family protein [Candidatus Bathyarchaeota archaeon]|nr:acetoacetate decarboxylase family protein [Candidatus Bathyarchaeota archaeon]